MSDSFWSGGADAYAKGLKQQYDAQLRKLTERLDTCEDLASRHQIQAEIHSLDQHYQQKRKTGGQNVH